MKLCYDGPQALSKEGREDKMGLVVWEFKEVCRDARSG